MCLRAVIELAVTNNIRRSKPAEYPKVSSKAIKALVSQMSSNPDNFFDPKAEYNLVKGVLSLAGSSHTDIMLLNNAAHGHGNPSSSEFDAFADNVEELVRWACKWRQVQGHLLAETLCVKNGVVNGRIDRR